MKHTEEILILLCILILATLGIMFYEVKGQTIKCLANPIGFGIDGLDNSNKADFICTCTPDRIGVPTLIITKNTTQVWRQA